MSGDLSTPPSGPPSARRAATRAGTSAERGYKRSWKNLLINKQYQLRFTLFMVALSALLMTGLGLWVMRLVNTTTTVGISRIIGDRCPEIPEINSAVPAAAPLPPSSTNPTGPTPSTELGLQARAAAAVALRDHDAAAVKAAEAAVAAAKADPKALDAATKALADARAAAESSATAATAALAPPAPSPDGERPHAHVVIDESSMTITQAAPIVPADFVEKTAARFTCELTQDANIVALRHGRRVILLVLLGSGVVLLFGLALYGIKMTHGVAGPLFKVSLYLAKMRDGRLDKVWNLRKGDQLMDFYEHFKGAHRGLRSLEKDDVAYLEQVIAAAEANGAAASSPAVADAIAELRVVLARKENSLAD